MKKLILFAFVVLLSTTTLFATKPTITIDGDKSDWAEIPMLSQPGTWPMLKVIPAADANMGDNALAFLLENNEAFTSDWSKYPGEYIDKDHNYGTGDHHWTYPDMGTDFSGTTGMKPSSSWVDFQKGKSADCKAIEMGIPNNCLTDLGEKFDIGMYYGTGGTQEWFIPKRSGADIDKQIGLFYKSRSYTTIPGTATAANAFAHNCIGECTDYVDFGLRDNGDDTARWAAFPIELTRPALYDVTTAVSSTNGWKFEFWLVDVATNAVVAHLDAPESDISSSKTSYTFGTLNLLSVPAGKYMLKVKNRTRYSKVQLQSVTLSYKGGAVVDIPETLLPVDVMLSSEAWVDKTGTVDSILFTARGSEGHNSNNWAKWRIKVSKTGYYNFTAHVCRHDGGQKYEIKVLSSDESSEIFTYTNTSIGSGDKTCSTGNRELEEGTYVVKVRNIYDNAKSRLLKVVATYEGGAYTTIPDNDLLADDAVIVDNGHMKMVHNNGNLEYKDNSSPTGEYAYWNIHAAKAGDMKVTLNVVAPAVGDASTHNFEVGLYSDLSGSSLSTAAEPSATSQTGARELSTKLYIPAEGDYFLRLDNQTQWSSAILHSVEFEYTGGAPITLPNTLTPADVLLSTRALVDNTGAVDSILFTPRGSEGYNPDEWAKWRIKVAKGGKYIFKANVSSSNGQYYKISVLSSDESSTIGEKDGTGTSLGKGDKTFATDPIELSAGEYVVKIVNTYAHSHGRVLNIEATYEGGAVVNVPDYVLLGADAVLDKTSGDKTMSHLANGDIKSSGQHYPVNEYAYWKVHATKSAELNVTLHMPQSDIGHQYYVEVCSTPTGAAAQTANEAATTYHGGAITLTQPISITEGTDYYIRLVNHTDYSSAVLHSISLGIPVTIDEAATTDAVLVEHDGDVVDASLTRTFVGGMNNTVCLPFAVNAEEKVRVFGAAPVKKMTSAVLDDAGVLTLLFEEVSEMEAGVPYLVKPAAQIANPTFLGVTIDNTLNNTNGTNADFIGNFVVSDPIAADPNNLYLGENNTLYYPAAEMTLNGMRAYFKVHSTGGKTVKRAKIVEPNNVTTDIEVITEPTTNNVVTVKALKIMQNGQVIILRDGVKYNALGQRIE